MLVNVTVKMPPNMKKALEKLAKHEFSSVSGILKKAAEKYLLEHGIDWRKDDTEETKE
jgi:predicted DNA-binding protein